MISSTWSLITSHSFECSKTWEKSGAERRDTSKTGRIEGPITMPDKVQDVHTASPRTQTHNPRPSLHINRYFENKRIFLSTWKCKTCQALSMACQRKFSPHSAGRTTLSLKLSHQPEVSPSVIQNVTILVAWSGSWEPEELWSLCCLTQRESNCAHVCQHVKNPDGNSKNNSILAISAITENNIDMAHSQTSNKEYKGAHSDVARQKKKCFPCLHFNT